MLLQASLAQAQPAGFARISEGPWDQSVRLEIEGDLQGAERVLVSTWGAEPNNFYVQLRLAYLALLGRRGPEAVERYKRTRSFPEALDDEDTTRGYAAALALRGWQLEENGERQAARRWWKKSLAVWSDQPDAVAGLRIEQAPITEPEVWGAMVGYAFGTGRYQAPVIFAQVPWRPIEGLTLRLAGRHVRWQQVSPLSPWAFSQQSAARWTVNEIYGGAGYESAALKVEGLGFAITSAGSPTLSGAGLRLVLGRDVGLSTDAAAFFQAGTWSNQQVRPLVFLTLGGWLVPHAGLRITRTGHTVWTSGVAGAWLVHGPFLAFLQGHLGTEQWAADLASPSILSIAPTSRMGGRLTAFYDVSRMLRMGVHVASERLAAEGATGLFWSAALGLQLRIFSL
jgi:hypothetical protein